MSCVIFLPIWRKFYLVLYHRKDIWSFLNIKTITLLKMHISRSLRKALCLLQQNLLEKEYQGQAEVSTQRSWTIKKKKKSFHLPIITTVRTNECCSNDMSNITCKIKSKINTRACHSQPYKLWALLTAFRCQGKWIFH